MARTNQRDEPIAEDFLYHADDFREGELANAVLLLLDHLKLGLVRTNATKHGNVMLQLRPKD